MKTLEIVVIETGKVYMVSIGRNRVENDLLVRSSDPDDTWFHLRDVSGPHIILHNAGDVIPIEYLRQIGEMFCLYKSGLPLQYHVIYTRIENVHLTKTKGMVNVSEKDCLVMKCAC